MYKENKLELFIALKLSGNEILPKGYYNKCRLLTLLQTMLSDFQPFMLFFNGINLHEIKKTPIVDLINLIFRCACHVE